MNINTTTVKIKRIRKGWSIEELWQKQQLNRQRWIKEENLEKSTNVNLQITTSYTVADYGSWVALVVILWSVMILLIMAIAMGTKSFK